MSYEPPDTLAADPSRRSSASVGGCSPILCCTEPTSRSSGRRCCATELTWRAGSPSTSAGGWWSIRPGFARLHKVAATGPDAAARLNDTPLTPRKYTLLFLACAALDEQPRQTTLSVLSENVAELSAAEDPIPTFDPSNSHSDRVAFAGCDQVAGRQPDHRRP